MNSNISFLPYLALKQKLESFRIDGNEDLIPAWNVPASADRGLLSTNISFQYSRLIGASPVDAGGRLCEQLEKFVLKNKLPFDIELSGPYVNVYLQRQYNQSLLSNSLTTELTVKDMRPVMLEYIGANVAKRLHAGHMRNLNIGDAIRRIMSLKYDNMITDNHWGDWGVQFGILIWAYKRNLNTESYKHNSMDELQKLYVWGNAQKDSVEGWSKAVRAEFIKLEAGDQENLALWKDFVQVSKQELKGELDVFDVPATDLEQGESYYEPIMNEIRAYMDKYSLWSSDDGTARFIDFMELSEHWSPSEPLLMKQLPTYGRCYLISSDGYTTYAFRDVAARIQWARDHKTELAVTVTDNTQEHNFNQAFAIVSYLAATAEFANFFGSDTAQKLAWKNLVHVKYGFLKLTSGKMSTRQGNVLRLSQLVNETEAAAYEELLRRDPLLKASTAEERARIVAIASLKWADLNRDPATDVTLDPEVIIKFEGNTGTYQLYTYARLKNILKKNEFVQHHGGMMGFHLDDDALRLQSLMYILPESLNISLTTYRPNILLNYIFELTEAVNSWYAKAPKLVNMDSDDPVKQEYLHLVHQITVHLEFCLDLIGIKLLDEL